MNIIDLELYRWHWFNLNKKIRDPFICTLPRQSGKTTMLIKMANMLQRENEDFLIAAPTLSEKNNITNIYNITPNKIFVMPKQIASANFILRTEGIMTYNNRHLLIDEYTQYTKNAVKELLRLDW